MAAIESVYKLVNEWQPGPLPAELKYRDSLAAFLRERLKEAQVETEYRHVGTTADIYVKESRLFSSSEVFVEIKRNLTQKAQLDRLVGQIHGLDPQKNKILVVFCGETSPALVSRFKELFQGPLDSVFGTRFQMGLVVKENAISEKK